MVHLSQQMQTYMVAKASEEIEKPSADSVLLLFPLTVMENLQLVQSKLDSKHVNSDLVNP